MQLMQHHYSMTAVQPFPPGLRENIVKERLRKLEGVREEREKKIPDEPNEKLHLLLLAFHPHKACKQVLNTNVCIGICLILVAYIQYTNFVLN